MNKDNFMKDKNVQPPKSKRGKKKNKENDCTMKFNQDSADEPVISVNIDSTEDVQKILRKISSKVEERDDNININNNKIERIQVEKCALQRYKTIDKTLQKEFKPLNRRKLNSILPIFKKRETILDLINKNQVIVIYSEQNCGKTTQIPQFILDNMIKNGNGSLCKIISTQPYKNKVTEAFKKVSKENKGVGINYQIRFKKHTENSPLCFCTSGIFLKLLSNSSILNNTSHLIVDEIQERDAPTDILLGIMKEIIKKRHDFKLILMCSTGYAKTIVKYFDGCPKICVTPDIFPTEEHYLEDILMLIDFKKLSSGKLEKKEDMHNKYPRALTSFVRKYERDENTNCELVLSLISYIYFKTRDGNILVLLPNTSEVIYVQTEIENHSALSKTQVITFLREENIEFNNKRKIFVTSNEKLVPIHESNIMYVINSGKIQNYKYDPLSNVETNTKDWISTKTLRERQKLAGRYKQGVCFHLFSQSSQENFHKYPEPKIKQESTDEIILEIKDFGVPNAEKFLQNCLSCPDIHAIRKTIETFKQNNILTNEEMLTPIGLFISKLPLNPSVGKMVILGLLFSCLRPVLIIAAYFSFRNIFDGKNSDILETKQKIGGTCDILLFLDVWNEFNRSKKTKEDFCNLYNINLNVMDDVENIIQQVSFRLFNMGFLEYLEGDDYTDLKYNRNSNNMNLVKSLLCISLYPNIAVIREHTCKQLKDAQIETIFDQKVHIQMSSINYNKISSSPLLLYRYISQQKNIMIQETSVVTPLQVLVFANDVNISDNGNDTNDSVITIAGVLKIQCNGKTATVIQRVRERFQQWLDYRMCYPKIINWEENNWDTLTMNSVLQLLSREI